VDNAGSVTYPTAEIVGKIPAHENVVRDGEEGLEKEFAEDNDSKGDKKKDGGGESKWFFHNEIVAKDIITGRGDMRIQRPIAKQPIPDQAKRVFSGKLFKVWQWKQELYDGSKTVFEKVQRADSVNVIPVTEEGMLVLTRQEQPGMEPFIGVAGGVIEVGEEVIVAAKRELREETGMEAEEWELLVASQPSGVLEWASYTLVARRLKKVGELVLDAGEKVELMEVGFEELVDLVCKEEFRDRELALLILAAAREKRLDELQKRILG